jgi:hypothetical protein
MTTIAEIAARADERDRRIEVLAAQFEAGEIHATMYDSRRFDIRKADSDDLAALLALLSATREALSNVIGDAYAYRLGECASINDPSLDPHDRERMVEIEQLADRLGIEIVL